MPAWIDVEHTPLEWALFVLAFVGLVALKLFARKKRREAEKR